MKILMIIDSLCSGGKERRMLELIKGLRKKDDYEIAVVILSDEVFYEQIYDLNIKVTCIKRKIKKDPLLLIKLYKTFNEFSPDIIQSWEPMASVYASIVAKILGIKFINAMIVNAPRKLLFKLWFRSKITFPLSDSIIGNSLAGLKAYKAPSQKSLCVHNGFDFERINNLIDKRQQKIKFNIKTEKIVGMVGSMSKRKDYTTYLKAAMGIINKRKDVTFLAVGDGGNFKRYNAMIPNKYKDYIIFTGNQKNVESIINIFDIGVLISEDTPYWSEGISNSILEYMALSKPVIATDCGGTKEIVANNLTGYIINPCDVEDLMQKIEYLLNNTEMANKMGKEGKQRIEENFNIEKMVTSFENVYKDLLLN